MHHVLVLLKVYTEDCSNLLDQILAETKGPRKGEVEMLVAGPPCQAVLRIRIHRIHMFLGLPDPDPLVRGMDPDPDPYIIMQK
jgi:hypothetical protein